MLAYFLNFNLFLGIYLVLYDLDLLAIILWIVYGGIIIIFFMYSLMWGELSNFFLFSKNLKFFIFILIGFIYLNSVDLIEQGKVLLIDGNEKTNTSLFINNNFYDKIIDNIYNFIKIEI